MRYIVRCTEIYSRSHRLLREGFKLLKPYVCENRWVSTCTWLFGADPADAMIQLLDLCFESLAA
jgi:hypothetical protein